MARRRRGPRMVWIPINGSIALGALTGGTVIATAEITFGEDFFLVGTKLTWTLRGLTGGEVPITVGFAHGDLTVAEVTEALDAELSDPDDIITKEQSRRPVRMVGAFNDSTTDQELNNGTPVRRVAKFSIGDGHSFNIWARNQSGATLTTGSTVQANGHIYGRWQR